MRNTPPWEPVDGWYWHSGHAHLVSWMTAAHAAGRWFVVATQKPERERPTRARLMHPVARPYPDWLAEAGRLWDEGNRLWAERERLRAEANRLWDEADWLWDDADRLLTAHAADLDALHAAQCPDCPWDGETIFPHPPTEDEKR